MNKTNPVRQVVFPLLAALIWGTAFVAQDMCADVIDAFTFNAVRFYIAVLVLLVIIWLFGRLGPEKPPRSTAERQTDRRQLLIGGFCCGTALAVASNFQQAGIGAGTDAGKAGFITALYIVLVPVLGLFLKKKVSLPVWISVVLAVAGLYLLCITGELKLAAGDLLILLCAFFFSVHILVIDHFTATVPGLQLSCAQFLVAALWSTAGALFFDHIDGAAILSCSLPLLYVGIFSCGVAYTLQILSQKGSNPTVVTILLSMESVFAVISGAIILHQHMTGREYLGCALMLIAVLLAQIPFPLSKKTV
ncbi:MAG: DMT family transporter [Ruminococcaceae bacterium]|nr:DMT family transporter [Oscillospiraceae bacterium]